MMNIRFFASSALCVAFLWTIGCNKATPTTYEKVDHFENGQVSRRTNFVNGKKEGKMTDYYNDGKLMAERFFVQDLQEGRTVIYYPDGVVKEVQYFQNGKREGGDTLWYEDGKIQFVTQVLKKSN